MICRRRVQSNLKRRLLSFAVVASLPLMITSFAGAEVTERSVVGLWKSLVPLTTVTSFMNTGAHPDDERSHMLAYYSLGLGSRTSSVIANRGEGGQNEIGKEYVNALGIIRSRELQEASKITNVVLYNLSRELKDPIFDFGFSKSPNETLQIWGRDLTLERLIRVIRQERPDVVMASFLNDPSQHGHHRAMTILTEEAFYKAGDPRVFPEHMNEGLHPWQPRKLYESVGEKDGKVVIPVGTYDPIYGRSYVQLGEESRFMHKSQGMGTVYAPGPVNNFVRLVDAAVPVSETEKSIFDGLPYTVADLASQLPDGFESLAAMLELVQVRLDATVQAFPSYEAVAHNAHRALSAVRTAIQTFDASDVPYLTRIDIVHRLKVKEEQLGAVSHAATLFQGALSTQDTEIVRGQTFSVTLSAFNGGRVPLQNVGFSLQVPDGWAVKATTMPSVSSLGYNETAKTVYEVTVPKDAPFFHPYKDHIVQGRVTYSVGNTEVSQKVLSRAFFAVLPDFSVVTNPKAGILNTLKSGQTTQVQVLVTSYRGEATKGAVRLKVPEGWSVEPKEKAFSFNRKGEMLSATFQVTPPANLAVGDHYVVAEAVSEAASSSSSVRVIEYPHIGRTYLVEPAQVILRAFPLEVAPVKVGYVASGFDSVPDALRQMGADVTLLTEEDLQFGDLSRWNTIVVGIYAYRYRPDLAANNQRVLDWVKNGGNLIVLNHRYTDNWIERATPPFYIRLGRPSIQWRVTDEKAPVEVLAPNHAVLNWPNKITEDDWDNWVKDRGFHFPMEWAPEYTPLLAMTDPGEENRRDELKGNTLWVRYGEGTYLYSSLIWYYQLEQLVPGAFRIFANFISQPMAK